MPIWTIGKIGDVEVDFNSDGPSYALWKTDRLGFRYGASVNATNQSAAEDEAATLQSEIDADRALEDYNTTTTAEADGVVATNLSSAMAWVENVTSGIAYPAPVVKFYGI